VTYAEVKADFDKMCRTFMVEDIRKGIDLATANYLVALGLLSYLEVLGGLITGNGAAAGGSFAKSNFEGALNHMPNEYAKLNATLKVAPATGKLQKGIYGVFRCGLVHEYAPKGQVIVYSKPNSAPDAARCGLEIDDDGTNKRLVVNNNELFRDFKALVEKVGGWVDTQDAQHYPNVKAVFERLDAYTIHA
jgi:hypothetical protein